MAPNWLLRSLRSAGGLSSHCSVAVNCHRSFPFPPRCIAPPVKFSTVSGKKKKPNRGDDNSSLIRIVDSEIKFALDSDLHDCGAEVPDGFPFKIKDKPGQRFIVLERDYQGETIRVTVDMSKVGYEENVDSEKGASDHNGKKEPELYLPVVVSISKGEALVLQFDVKMFPEKMSIYGVSIRGFRVLQPSENFQAHEGPSFLDLNSDLQEAFHKYLEARGLTSGTTEFLLEYVITKDAREYLRWLKNLRKIFKN